MNCCLSCSGRDDLISIIDRTYLCIFLNCRVILNSKHKVSQFPRKYLATCVKSCLTVIKYIYFSAVILQVKVNKERKKERNHLIKYMYLYNWKLTTCLPGKSENEQWEIFWIFSFSWPVLVTHDAMLELPHLCEIFF